MSGVFPFAAILAAAPLFHLDSAADRGAFRAWFTYLAESRFYATQPNPEITDCAALVRWAYRQSLVSHDATWATMLKLPWLPAMPPVRHLPADPRLFHTSAFAIGQFADADTLRRFNTYFISRNVSSAQRGDLLFYRQFDRKMPAHVMICIGVSQFEPSATRWLIYHTGPSGEVRKVRLEDMLAHPSPEWRPVPGNSNFLGVYRLTILRDSQ